MTLILRAASCGRNLAALAFFLSALVVHSASAAPTINNVSPRGLQLGAKSTLVIEGAELGPNTRVLGVPAAEQTVKPGSTAERVEIELALQSGAAPGMYALRVGSASGVSNAAAIGIDALPQQAFGPQIAALPIAMTGSITGNAVLNTTFAGKKGERIVVDVESRRIGANLNPMLHVLDARRLQVAWSAAQPALQGDARCEVTLPADGQYTIELHDMVYRGAEPGYFRMKIGSLGYADLAFPLAVQAGASAEVELAGGTLAGSRIPLSMSEPGIQAVPWPGGAALLVGPRPKVIVSEHIELIESAQQPGQLQELPAAPVAISGKLDAPNQDDRYRLPVTPGTALRFDVLAMRAGSPVDGVLTVLNEQGGGLASNDDRPRTSDPGLDFTVPADVTKLIVSLKDLRGAGSAGHVYRIAVTPVAQPGFELTVDDRHQVPVSGTALMRVRAERNSFGGAIKLALAGLPATIAATGLEIPAGATQTLVTLNASMPGEQNLIALVGESTDPNAKVARSAKTPETALSRHQPWLANEVAIAAVPAGPLQLVWETPPSDLKLGMPQTAKIKLTRAAGATGNVRLSLITTQVVPKKTVKVNNIDQQVDDTDKAVRLENPPMLADAQQDAELKVSVPADLPAIPYDLAIQAELLAADGKTAIATAFTPAVRVNTTP